MEIKKTECSYTRSMQYMPQKSGYFLLLLVIALIATTAVKVAVRNIPN